MGGGGGSVGRHNGGARHGLPPPPSSSSVSEAELAAIRAHYMGEAVTKKRLTKPTADRSRFQFDWDASDDTTAGASRVAGATDAPALLFGRGRRAGVDVREQVKAGAAVAAASAARARAAEGATTTAAHRAADAAAASAAASYVGYDRAAGDHWSAKPLSAMTERDWRIFREDFNISYKGAARAALPMRSWSESTLPPDLMQAVATAGYVKPSPIQMAAIPLGLAGRDVIGIAETGSGKTAAFALPLLAYCQKQPPMDEVAAQDGPYAVILAPTRELAQQIDDETRTLARYTRGGGGGPFRVVTIVGGVSIEDQGFKLRQGCEIVVATPGRLVDCLEKVREWEARERDETER